MRDKLPKMMNECRFLAAAKQSIEKSTFHALPWSIENIGWIAKVKVLFWENLIIKSFCFQLTCITYFLVASIIAYYFTIDAVYIQDIGCPKKMRISVEQAVDGIRSGKWDKDKSK